MSIRDTDVFENIINLTATIEDIENGGYDNLEDINRLFVGYMEDIRKYRRLAKDAFNKQSTCTHERYHKVHWSIRKSLLNYYVHFEKTCMCCGKTEYLTLQDWSPEKDDFPEGYEGATKQYWNLNI